MSNKTWKEVMLNYIDCFYGEKAEAWKNERNDKRVFSNTYFMIVEALESLPDEPHNYVKVAVHAHIKENEEMMKRIIERFERLENVR